MSISEFSSTMNLNSKQKENKNKRAFGSKVDRVLLGPLTKDTEFLKRLMENQKFIVKKKDKYGEEVQDIWQDEVKVFVFSLCK